VVEGAPEAVTEEVSAEDAVALARRYVAEGLSASEAAKRAAAESGRRKGEIYKQLTTEG